MKRNAFAIFVMVFLLASTALAVDDSILRTMVAGETVVPPVATQLSAQQAVRPAPQIGAGTLAGMVAGEVTVPRVVTKTRTVVRYVAVPVASETTTHVVQKGDYLDGIAKSFETSREVLMALNPAIKSPHLILLGQKLKVPAKKKVETEKKLLAASLDESAKMQKEFEQQIAILKKEAAEAKKHQAFALAEQKEKLKKHETEALAVQEKKLRAEMETEINKALVVSTKATKWNAFLLVVFGIALIAAVLIYFILLGRNREIRNLQEAMAMARLNFSVTDWAGKVEEYGFYCPVDTNGHYHIAPFNWNGDEVVWEKATAKKAVAETVKRHLKGDDASASKAVDIAFQKGNLVILSRLQAAEAVEAEIVDDDEKVAMAS